MAKIQLAAISLDCEDHRELAEFYAKLLGSEVKLRNDLFAYVPIPGTGLQLNFLAIEGYQPPTWPETPEKQQQMEHLDFLVDDREQAVAQAIQWGAKKAGQQFLSHLTVMMDPAGHPFCLIQKQ